MSSYHCICRAHSYRIIVPPALHSSALLMEQKVIALGINKHIPVIAKMSYSQLLLLEKTSSSFDVDQKYITLEIHLFFSSCIVRVYVIKDDSADQVTELTNDKSFLSADQAYAITAKDDDGTPADSITGTRFVFFYFQNPRPMYENL